MQLTTITTLLTLTMLAAMTVAFCALAEEARRIKAERGKADTGQEAAMHIAACSGLSKVNEDGSRTKVFWYENTGNYLVTYKDTANGECTKVTLDGDGKVLGTFTTRDHRLADWEKVKPTVEELQRRIKNNKKTWTR